MSTADRLGSFISLLLTSSRRCVFECRARGRVGRGHRILLSDFWLRASADAQVDWPAASAKSPLAGAGPRSLVYAFRLIPVRRKFVAWDCKVTPADCACQERNTTGCISSNDGADAGTMARFSTFRGGKSLGFQSSLRDELNFCVLPGAGSAGLFWAVPFGTLLQGNDICFWDRPARTACSLRAHVTSVQEKQKSCGRDRAEVICAGCGRNSAGRPVLGSLAGFRWKTYEA